MAATAENKAKIDAPIRDYSDMRRRYRSQNNEFEGFGQT
jgi:hypothetical protein